MQTCAKTNDSYIGTLTRLLNIRGLVLPVNDCNSYCPPLILITIVRLPYLQAGPSVHPVADLIVVAILPLLLTALRGVTT